MTTEKIDVLRISRKIVLIFDAASVMFLSPVILLSMGSYNASMRAKKKVSDIYDLFVRIRKSASGLFGYLRGQQCKKDREPLLLKCLIT